ncbi:hypothetical protein [Micromonospora sp. 4G55]|uniref:hypothetical protein n=1 Tax=Micromonospora sp. 4G55 TaxID=2806102 RepID=UPI001A557B7B|nr:hypothetical protein [Micromonospora sp. 4G55]MBM0255757.1 hypothetical protein [Micromonospora sp. 4G55]
MELPNGVNVFQARPTDWIGNTYAGVNGDAPSGVDCYPGGWTTTLVRINPNGEVRQTPLNVCDARYAYTSPDGLFIRGSLPDTLTKLDSDGKRSWQYQPSDWDLSFGRLLVGADGNIAVHEANYDIWRAERVIVLDGRSGHIIWSWSNSSTTQWVHWQIANNRIYLQTRHCDDGCSTTVGAYNAPLALDYPRSDLLVP